MTNVIINSHELGSMETSPCGRAADLDASKRHLEILEFLLKVRLTQMQIGDQ